MRPTIGEAQAVFSEAISILEQHMDPAKVDLVRDMLRPVRSDFLEWRDREFANETVDTLFEKVRAFEQTRGRTGGGGPAA